jgi:hypothetical protein
MSAIPERRNRNRYPLQFDLEYRVFTKGHSVVAGSARTVNISSGGVLLTSTEGIKKGELMEISIRWQTVVPTAPNTKLEILGRVIRVDSSGTAVRILRYGLYPQPATELESASA